MVRLVRSSGGPSLTSRHPKLRHVDAQLAYAPECRSRATAKATSKPTGRREGRRNLRRAGSWQGPGHDDRPRRGLRCSHGRERTCRCGSLDHGARRPAPPAREGPPSGPLFLLAEDFRLRRKELALFLAGGDFHHVWRCWPLTQPSSPHGPQQRARSARRPPAAAPAAVRSRLAAVRANAGQRYYLSQESEEPRKSTQGAREVALACSPTCAMWPTG